MSRAIPLQVKKVLTGVATFVLRTKVFPTTMLAPADLGCILVRFGSPTPSDLAQLAPGFLSSICVWFPVREWPDGFGFGESEAWTPLSARWIAQIPNLVLSLA